jgi:phosphate uptake regulator
VTERALGRFSGFEVLENADTHVRLQNLLKTDNADIKNTTVRPGLITVATHRDAVTAVVGGDETLARRVTERDAEADEPPAVVVRHFRRSLTDLAEITKLGQIRDELFEYYYTAGYLERVADHAVKIARFTLELHAS